MQGTGRSERTPLHFHFPRREEPEPDVPRQRTAGGPPPARHPLPSFPARHPARSGPYLPALRLPGRPARCGRQGEWAGGPAGGRWTVRYPAPDMAHRLGRHSRPGGQGRKERQPRAPGRWARWREIPAVPTFPVRCATQGLCCPAAHLGVRASGLPLAGGGVLLRVSRFLRSPSPPRGLWAQLLPPTPSRACGRDPGGACPAPAQRPPSAHPAPSRLQCDPWRLGGPLAPKRLLTTHTMLQDTTGRPLKSKAILVTYAMQALGRALKA